MFQGCWLLASAIAAPPVQVIDFEAVEVTGEVVRPSLSLVNERVGDEAPVACEGLLEAGLADLPAPDEVDTPRGTRQLRQAERSAGLEPAEEDVLLARARICLEWRHGERTTAGGYALFVSEEKVDYCARRVVAYADRVSEDEADRAAVDEAGVESELCLVDPERRPLARDPYERAQTAFSEARLGRYAEGGAAEGLYRAAVRRVGRPVSREVFLQALAAIDASGQPVAAFVAGRSDHPWKPARILREAVALLDGS